MADETKPSKLHWLADFVSHFWTDILLPILPAIAAVSVFVFTDEFLKYWLGHLPIDPDYVWRFKTSWCLVFFVSVIAVVMS